MSYYLDPAKSIFADVAEGLAPFRPLAINLWHEQDIDFRRTHIYIEVKSLPHDRFTMTIEEREFVTAGNPMHVFDKVGLAARSFFHNVYVPPEDHIYLGEN